MRGLDDGWLLTAADLALCLRGPAALPPSKDRAKGLWLGLGQARIFSMPEIPLYLAALSARFKTWSLPVGLGVSWQQTGNGFLKTTDQELIVRAGGDFHLGVRIVARTLALEGRSVGRILDRALFVGIPVDLGGDVRAVIEMTLGLPDEDPAAFTTVRRPLAKAKVVRPGGGIAVGVDRLRTGEPVLSFEVQWAPVAGLAVGIRADPSTASLGPGIAWQRGKLMIRTSHLVHPDLGATHRFFLNTGQMGAGLW